MLNYLIDLLFPKTCVCCEKALNEQEPHICGSCCLELPVLETNDESALRKLVGRVKIEKAYGYLKFNKLGKAQKILHELKYKDNQELGVYMGEIFGIFVNEKLLINKIDLILPVPLHSKRLKSRGYNQAEAIAIGLAKQLEIKLDATLLVKSKEAISQTKKGRFARLENMQDCFTLASGTDLRGKHVAIVDDVVTTGATLEACCQCLLNAGVEQITVLSLAVA